VEVKIAVNKPTDKVQQRVYVCRDAEKEALLCHLFGEIDSRRVIVFASSKLKVKDLARALRRKKLKVGEMHSDLDQNTREEVMRNFRAGHIDILVATDIVARGIDIDDISMVVNFDVPHDSEDYVHRIGRTARAGETGVAVTLVGERERRKFRAIEEFIGGKIEHSPLPEGFSPVTERRAPAAKDSQSGKDDKRRRSNSRNRGGRNHSRKRSSSSNKNSNNNHTTNKSSQQ
jgi:superfamily II DNA/RNA helicase